MSITDDLETYAKQAMPGYPDDLCSRAKAEIERLRAIVADACQVLRHYDLPEHAYHYERVLAGLAPLSVEQTANGESNG